MQLATHHDWLADAMARFTSLIGQSDLDAQVPSCPDWNVAALVEHLVGIHLWVGRIVPTGEPAQSVDVEAPERTPHVYAAWYADQAATLRSALAATDPDAPCWNFSGINPTYAFWPRRQAHEVTVHAFDAALASGSEFSVDPAVAADGIDEILSIFGPRMAQRGYPARVLAPIKISPTDVDVSWTVRPPDDAGAPVVTHDDGATDATLSGTASDLYLRLWRRLPVERITITGDASTAKTYLESRLTA